MATSVDRSLLWLVMAPALLAGCASAPQYVPPEFALARARIEASAEPPQLMQSAAGKPAGAVQGAAAGAVSVGLYAGLITAAPCVFMGFLAGPCFAAMVPAAAATGAAIGGATGAVVGARAADSEEVAQAKIALLESALARVPVRDRLVDELRRQARESAKADAPAAPAGPPGITSPWILAVGTIFITAEPGGDAPYGLRATVNLTLKETGQPRPAFEKRYSERSRSGHFTAEWQADDASAVRAALDELLARLAATMVADLQSIELRCPPVDRLSDGLSVGGLHHHPPQAPQNEACIGRTARSD